MSAPGRELEVRVLLQEVGGLGLEGLNAVSPHTQTETNLLRDLQQLHPQLLEFLDLQRLLHRQWQFPHEQPRPRKFRQSGPIIA